MSDFLLIFVSLLEYKYFRVEIHHLLKDIDDPHS